MNISRPEPQTAYVNMKKLLILWMIFRSKLLLRSFLMSVYYAVYSSEPGLDRLGMNHFLILRNPFWVTTHTLGVIGNEGTEQLTERCAVRPTLASQDSETFRGNLSNFNHLC